jgi:hypothetical protein
MPAKAMSSAMGAAVRDKVTSEDLLRSSGLNYTIVHAVRLTNGPATGTARTAPQTETLRLGNTISRAELATWLLNAATDTTTASHSAVALTA